ncbi:MULTISPECIES: hypothetical protein [Streptomyces]|uniref:Uncharacterized protein n=1 Tax=Streptomyces griseocarneus TaxID=51201 RepID=A0ABX7RGU2_9ACTN|nr:MULTISPECIES: hypothetical protein [Streptomyces]QSY47420.1 hypothetical protein J3S04_19025 [Streptomyces griseocarneus]
MNTYPTSPALPVRPSRRKGFTETLAVVLWAITAHALGLCLVVVAMIAVWGAAAGTPVGEFLLPVAGVLAAAALVLAAAYQGLKLFGLSAPTRSAIVAALACPGPVGLALYLYAG